MRLVRSGLGIAIAALLVAGCGQTGSQVLPGPSQSLPAGTGAITPLGASGGRALPPPAFRPGVDRLHPDSTPWLNRTIASRVQRFPLGHAIGRPLSSGRATQGTIVHDDAGGQAGTQIYPTNQYGSMSANHSVWSNFRLSGNDVLYAPTMKPPGRACLEATTIYYGSATPSVGFWDFCIPNNGQFYGSKNVDATFINTYVRDLGDGVPRYSVLITVDPANPTGWMGALWNYYGSFWELIYSDGGDGTVQGGNGWDLFETHYHNVPETCPYTPPISATGISLGGNLVTNGQALGFSEGECFTTTYGPNPYIYSLTGFDNWNVVAPTPAPTPVPTPTPNPTRDPTIKCGRYGCL